MYYEDESRRFNLLSGLLIGALVGAGVWLVVGRLFGLTSRLPALGRKRRSWLEPARGKRKRRSNRGVLGRIVGRTG